MSKDSIAKLFTLSLGFFLLLNYPILTIADQPGLFLNMPWLYFYLFVLWLIFIVITRHLVRRPKK